MIVDLANIVILKLHIRQTDTCAAPEPSNDHCILPLGLLYTPPYIGKYAIGLLSISHLDILLKTMIFFYPWSENKKEIYFFLFQCQQRIYFRFKSPDTKWPGVKWHPSLHPPPPEPTKSLAPPPVPANSSWIWNIIFWNNVYTIAEEDWENLSFH